MLQQNHHKISSVFLKPRYFQVPALHPLMMNDPCPRVNHVMLDTGNMKSRAFYQSLHLQPRREGHCLPGRGTQGLYLSTQGMCNGCGKQDLQHEKGRLPLVTMGGCNWLV